jgi:myo-inositol 2-dehydrogenase / D-chiro-inositol 1-dehydrogenase
MPQLPPPPGRPLRLAVAGLGAVAQAVHLPLVNRRPDLFELVSVFDVSPTLRERVGTRFGVPAARRYADLEAMLDGDPVDAVMILTGGSHAPAVVAAFERGYPVFCEKPLAFTEAEVDQIEAAVPPQLTTPPLFLAYMKQYDPAVTEAVRLLADVEEICAVDVTVLHPTGASQLEFASLVPFAHDAPDPGAAAERDRAMHRAALGDQEDAVNRLYSGALLSSLTHDLSLLRLMTGPPAEIGYVDVWAPASARTRREVGRDVRALGERPPSISVAGRLAGQARVSMRWHYLADYPAYRETVTIHHGAGSLELVFPSPYLLNTPTRLTVVDESSGFERRSEHRSVGEAFELELVAFYEMVTEGRVPLSSITDGRTDVITCQQIMSCYAARTGLTLGGEAARVMARTAGAAPRPEPIRTGGNA